MDANTVTKVEFRIGDFCVSTEDHPEIIALETSATRVGINLGKIPDIQVGRYQFYLTVFDAIQADGVPWGSGIAVIREWPKCDT